jgi:hypothetical protein
MAQCPETQWSPGQHSPSMAHAAPDAGEQSHWPTSQTPEQHSVPVAHDAAKARQAGPLGGALSPPPLHAERNAAIAIAGRTRRWPLGMGPSSA